MSGRLILAVALLVLLCMVAGTASADRLILTPSGNTLTTGGLRAEYANNADGDGIIYWANVGIGRFEIEGARFDDFGGDEMDVFSVQAEVLPETSFAPAIGIGVRNITDESISFDDGGFMTETGTGVLRISADLGALKSYNERSFYVVATKSLPATGGMPGLIDDLAVSGGVGTGGLSGFFFGAEGNIRPLGVRAAVEYDSEDWNWAVSYGIAAIIRARIYSMGGDMYFGAMLSTAF